MGSSQLDSLLRSAQTARGEKGRALTKICRFFFIFLCQLWLVFGDNGNKTRQRQTAVSPHLSCTELKISFRLRSGWISTSAVVWMWISRSDQI